MATSSNIGPLHPHHPPYDTLSLGLLEDAIQGHMAMLRDHAATNQRFEPSFHVVSDLELDLGAFGATHDSPLVPSTSLHALALPKLSSLDWSHTIPFSTKEVGELSVFHEGTFDQLQPPSLVDSSPGNKDGRFDYESAPDMTIPEVGQQQQQQHRSRSTSAFPGVKSLLQAICLDSVPSDSTANPASTSHTPLKQAISSKLKYSCTHEGCKKSFSASQHLKVHTYSHTGERPYKCSVGTCDKTFSQAGNCHTHERRHYGVRPTRKRRTDPHKRYECLLDDCRVRPKTFATLGNLRKHMERLHKETLARLASQSATLSTEEKELKMHISSLFQNINKGIKGRGKGRKVEIIGEFPAGSGTCSTS